MFLYPEQDVNLAQQSCSGFKNLKIKKKNVKNPGKNRFAVRMEWVNTALDICGHDIYSLFTLNFDQLGQYHREFKLIINLKPI